MKTTFALLLGLALVGSTQIASAQQGRGRGPAGQRPGPQRPQVQEPAAAQQFPPAVAALFDKDGDAVLSPTEIGAAASALNSADANKDGELTKEEVCLTVCPNDQECPAGQPPGRGQGRGRGFGAKDGQAKGPAALPLIIALFDADKDGKLSVSEISNAPAVLGALDANADAQLTPEELRPLAGRGGGPRGGGPRGANCPMQGANCPVQE